MEYRRFTNTVEDRDKESRSVSGYASVFNSESRDLGFFETIAPGAITEETIKESDVFATLNHDPDKVLARSNHGVGSLELFVDDRGLHYRYDAPHTDLGNSVLEHIDRGDLTDASFAFTIADEPDAQKWEKRDGKIYRTIYKIDRLYDISNVWTGAYAEASTHRNSPDEYEKYINELNAQEEIAKREAEQERVNKINENLDNKLKEFYKNIKI
jgi:hypothetical protein